MINSRNLIYTNILDLTRVQAQLNEFVKQNPDMKKPEQEQAQELKM